jgi:quercetin dioxygenase-like cupin family protein
LTCIKEFPASFLHNPSQETTMEATAPLDLLTAAPIVPGANVSRPVHETQSCKIVLFAMDAGQAISAHTVHFPALVQVLDGELEVTVGDAVHTVGPAQMQLLPKGVPHGVKAIKPARWILTMIRGG